MVTPPLPLPVHTQSRRRYSRSSASNNSSVSFPQPRSVFGFTPTPDIQLEETLVIGSYTAQREDIRDGSAQLASLSLSIPSPTETLDIPFASHLTAIPTPIQSPSGLAKALAVIASTPSPPIPSPTSTPHILISSDSQSPSSPASIDDVTPTQSKPGSPPSLQSALSEARTRSYGTITNRRLSRSHSSKRDPSVVILGDQVAGDVESSRAYSSSEEEEDENTPLHHDRHPHNGNHDETTHLNPSKRGVHGLAAFQKKTTAFGKLEHWIGTVKHNALNVKLTRKDVVETAETAVTSIPAVVLGILMNILDGVSYGMIMFPTNLAVFGDFGGIGVSMFFVSTLVSQLVYSGGGSIFKGGNGSMMIEVVPFYHVIAGIISAYIGDSTTKSIVATTMVAYALSSILTGFTFFALGALKLGSLSEFFPRHILVGCIGGVGAFLFITGMSISARLDESTGVSSGILRHLFDNDVLLLWVIPLLLAITLRIITTKYNHPLIFPGFFLSIPVVFWVIALSLGIPIADLRTAGWVFEVNGVNSEWYEYWTLFDFGRTDWGAIIETIPTQLALVFFGLLHVPINVPALAISIGEDNVDTNRELIAHGISNVAAGLVGTCPNYLVYSNSCLFYKVGGTSRVAGLMLATATAGLLVAGPSVIGYLPVCVVSALIFVLGIDLMKEAVFDTYNRVARFEYITIWAIVFTMTVFDFVLGIGVGILLACVSFVVSSSQRRAIRSILNGAVARSTVRRHPKQSAFLKQVGSQTRVIKLQGFLFFGTISACEGTIRRILEEGYWDKDPIRFLVLDFSNASGVDFSAAEAFVRIQRLLQDKGVILVLCGCPIDSTVGQALRSVDLWAEGDVSTVEVFENLNDALEHCENAFLRSLYTKDFGVPHIASQFAPGLMSQIDVPKSETSSDVDSFEQSPRAHHLRSAARDAMALQDSSAPKIQYQQPLPLLLQSLRPFSPEMNEDFCFRLVPYFNRVHVERGTELWRTDSSSDCFYLIESGMLRANYLFLDGTYSIQESMVAGTVAGDMTFLSRSKRNATVLAERDSVLWKMDIKNHETMGAKEGWTFCRRFEECLLKIASEEQEVLMGHLISSL